MRPINIKWFYWLSAAIALWFRFELDLYIYRLCFQFGARTSQRANYVGMSHCIRRGIQIQYQAHNNKWNRSRKKKSDKTMHIAFSVYTYRIWGYIEWANASTTRLIYSKKYIFEIASNTPCMLSDTLSLSLSHSNKHTLADLNGNSLYEREIRTPRQCQWCRLSSV